MPITKLRPTFTFDQERLDALRAIAEDYLRQPGTP